MNDEKKNGYEMSDLTFNKTSNLIKGEKPS